MSSWRESTSGSATIWLVMAALALAPGALFFTSVILIDYLGIGALEPMRADLLGPNDSLHRTLTDGAIVMGPVAAMVLAVMPWLRGGQLLDAEGRAALLVSRGGRLALLFVGAGVLLAAIFFTYFVGENWQCLVGAAASC